MDSTKPIQWIHIDGSAYNISHIVRIWRFKEYMQITFDLPESTRPYGERTYTSNHTVSIKDESIARKLCEHLGCDFDKLKVVEGRKSSESKSKYAPDTDSDPVPF